MKYGIWIIHFLFWVTGLLLLNISYFNLTLGKFNIAEGTMLWGTLWGTSLNILIFYGNAKILMPKWLEQDKKRYFSLLSLLFLLICGIEIFVDYLYLKAKKPTLEFFDFELIFIVIFFNAFFLLISFGYGFALIWIENQKRQRLLMEEKLQSELAFLKLQINPHFLFNTLNNLFALSRKNGDQETSGQIAKLANLMRYMLYETNSENVPLSREIDYLKNYIELQKLRFASSDELEITTDWGNENAHQMIAPFLLLPLVENAFKYGVSLQRKSFIHIQLNNELADELSFSVTNSFHSHQKKEEFSGIGLENLYKRLEILYPNKHQIHINKDVENGTFKAKLILRK